MGGVHLHVHTYRCAPFLYLVNGWTDCAETWCVVRGLLGRYAFYAGWRMSARVRVTVRTSVRSRSFIAQKVSYWFYNWGAYVKVLDDAYVEKIVSSLQSVIAVSRFISSLSVKLHSE